MASSPDVILRREQERHPFSLSANFLRYGDRTRADAATGE